IEAELKPKVVETFDNVADAYKRLRRLQDQDIQNKLRNDSLSPAQERRYKKLKDDIISEVKSLRLNQARIDALVEQLYDINRRLVGYEGRLMRLAEGHGVAREDFLKNYQVCLSETYALKYWWCSPPRTGIASGRPTVWTARGTGASLCSDRCVRAS